MAKERRPAASAVRAELAVKFVEVLEATKRDPSTDRQVSGYGLPFLARKREHHKGNRPTAI